MRTSTGGSNTPHPSSLAESRCRLKPHLLPCSFHHHPVYLQTSEGVSPPCRKANAERRVTKPCAKPHKHNPPQMAAKGQTRKQKLLKAKADGLAKRNGFSLANGPAKGSEGVHRPMSCTLTQPEHRRLGGGAEPQTEGALSLDCLRWLSEVQGLWLVGLCSRKRPGARVATQVKGTLPQTVARPPPHRWKERCCCVIPLAVVFATPPPPPVSGSFYHPGGGCASLRAALGRPT